MIQPSDWEDVYRNSAVEELPWYNPHLDTDILLALGELKITQGKVLDIGSGPGTQAIELARRGFKVTGLDVSKTAVDKAVNRAKEARVDVKFVSGDILSAKVGKGFDIAIDRGCLHIIDTGKRPEYVKIVHGLLKSGGYLLLKTFSHKEPPGPGPYRFKPAEIRGLFKGQFREVSLGESAFRGITEHAPKALFCILQSQKKA